MSTSSVAIKLVYVGSLVLHVALLRGVSEIEVRERTEVVTVTMRVVDPPPEPPPPPPEPEPSPPEAPPVVEEAPAPPPPPAPEPPPPPPPPPRPPRSDPPPAAAEAAAPAATGTGDGIPDFGVVLGGGAGPGGIHVPVGSPDGQRNREEVARTEEPAVRRTERRRVEREPTPEVEERCEGETRERPTPRQVARPAFTDEARNNGISGRVRVRVQVDESGEVTDVELLEGLGYGLDERALEAARNARFDPALRCGTPVAAAFTISMRFDL